MGAALKTTSLRGISRYNENAPTEAWNSPQGLTHSLDYGKEGLALDATQIPERVQQRALTRYTIDPERGCHISTYSVGSHGYAQIGWHDKSIGRSQMVLVHRVAYMVARGPIPEGMTVDHMCKQRKCCNPDHLRLLSNYENARRTGGRDWPVGQCINGHPNSMLHRQRGGKIVCAPCLQASRERWIAKKSGEVA